MSEECKGTGQRREERHVRMTQRTRFCIHSTVEAPDDRTGSIERRAPKNIAWATDLFAGPGGLADHKTSLEAFLATHVEGPAAFALHSFASRPPGQHLAVPSEVGRYMAWAAARSVSMRELYQEWIDGLPEPSQSATVESPADGFDKMTPLTRTYRMEHPTFGIREDVPSDDVELLRTQGWRFVLGADDFLELVHLQAWYFQVRFFPRLRWIILDAPRGGFFLIADRSRSCRPRPLLGWPCIGVREAP